ncbi:hypothetical protein SAMN02927937_01958 [Paenimyroides aquimaris]|uniref:Uncharacterized protein n=1 Tax=Paenimyroides marinum TaxID=1159016 RepID=A0A1H6LUR2_9FLAO|nr:hypothetical protein [Paenimyroides aquimaris]SEH88784.1 hypothetical protein SAMN02927937_01958 [Paenimyroides aquimaris]
MKYILYSVLFITFFSCNKKEENKPIQKIEKEYITDPLVYEVINAVLDMPEIKKDSAKYMLNTANLFLFDLGMDGEDFFFHAEKYFGAIDTVSIENQIKKSRYSFYKQEEIKSYQLIDYDLTSINTDEELDSLNNSVNKYIPHLSISFPIFNKEKNIAHISYYYYCGFLCGLGKQMFIKKVNNKWEILIVYNETIS